MTSKSQGSGDSPTAQRSQLRSRNPNNLSVDSTPLKLPSSQVPLSPGTPHGGLPRDQEAPLSLTFKTFLFLVGATAYSNYSLLSALAKRDGKIQFESASVMVLSESGKFVLSLFMLFREIRKQQAAAAEDNGSDGHNDMDTSIAGAFDALRRRLFSINMFMLMLKFLIPAGFYMVCNNLDVIMANHMDPCSQQALVQNKILMTSVMWWGRRMLLINK
jgi:hypothetical protein